MKIKKINNTKGAIKVKPKSNLLVAVGSGVVFLGVAAGLYIGLSEALARDTYYVLNVDVAPKTRIKPEMLKAVETSKGSAPQNAFTAQKVRESQIYSKYLLKAGDVISQSNTGEGAEAESGVGIPDDWVRTSFVINTNNISDPNLGRGDYIDILVVDEKGDAQYKFVGLLILDSAQETDNNVQDKDGKVASLGKQKQFSIGLPADSAAVLHSALAQYGDRLKIVTSPYSIKYKQREAGNLDKKFNAANVKYIDVKPGTDPTFQDVQRDENGAPIQGQAATQPVQQEASEAPKEETTTKKEG